jgi:hypothetical protein
MCRSSHLNVGRSDSRQSHRRLSLRSALRQGGGHSLNIGAANANVGVTLGMRALNSVSVQSDGPITSVGAGAGGLPGPGHVRTRCCGRTSGNGGSWGADHWR